MANILVISDPPAAPGYLPRLRYLCDYLVRRGYGVTVLTEEYQPLPFAHDYPIVTLPMYTGGTFDWAVKTVWTLVTDWHNKAFAKKFINHKSQIINHKYDLVLCTAFSDFPLGAAQRLAKHYGVPLLCDIRDLDEQVDDSRYQYRHRAWWTMPFRRLYRAVHIRRRNAVLRAADAVTTVSPWHAEFIRAVSHQPSAVSIVYNGFDEKQFYPAETPADAFRITYIGSLFDWQQPALETVRRVVEAMRQEGRDIQIEMHTPQHDTVPYDRLGDTIRSSSVMLVLTHPGTHGMLTTKFYEALGCAKPVLCVPSDKGALAELIAYTHAGIATDEPEAIRSFLDGLYREWQKRHYTLQPTQHREDFSREHQCEQMEAVIQKIINHKS